MKAPVIVGGIALAYALIAAGYITFADSYHGISCTATLGGAQECTSQSHTLIEENGRWVLALIAVPVTLTSLGLLTLLGQLPKVLGIVLAGAQLFLCFLAIFSIGLLFLPAAIVLLIALVIDRRPVPAI